MNTTITGTIPHVPSPRTIPCVEIDSDLVSWQQSHDEAAFTRLVEQHTSLVAAVCRRQLGSTADAEEAAQAVFLILARRAGEIHPPSRLASWLYGVAVNVCRNARRAAASRLRHEREAGRLAPQEQPPSESGWEALRPYLDAALSSLNQGQREAVIGHYFEGLPQAAVAVRLGISEDAAKKRIHYAVDKLRAWFGKRGMAVTVVTLSVGLASETGAAEPALVAACTTAALQPALAPVGVTSLASSVTGSIGLPTVAAVCLAGALLLGAGLMAWQTKPPAGAVAAVTLENPPIPAIAVVDPALQVILDRRITVRFTRSYLAEVLTSLRQQTGLQGVYPRSLSSTFLYSRHGEATVREVLGDLAKQGGLVLEYRGTTAVFWRSADPTKLAVWATQLREGSRVERLTALYALAESGDPRACALLLGVMRDPEPMIGNGAMSVLADWPITMQDLALVPTQWLAAQIQAGDERAIRLAAQCRDPETFAALIQGLQDERQRVKDLVVTALGRRGDPTALASLRAYHGGHAAKLKRSQKQALEHAISKLEVPLIPAHEHQPIAIADASAELEAQLNDPLPAVRCQAIEWIGNDRDERFLERLSLLAKDDLDIQVRTASIHALAVMRDERAVPVLSLLASDPHPGIRTSAVQALSFGGFDSPQAFEILHTMMLDSDPIVEQFSIMGLGEMREPRATEALLDIVVQVRGLYEQNIDPSEATSVASAAVALKMRKDPRAIPALLEMLDAPDPEDFARIQAMFILDCDDGADETTPP